MRAGESRDNAVRFDYRQKKKFLFSMKSRPALRPTQPYWRFIILG